MLALVRPALMLLAALHASSPASSIRSSVTGHRAGALPASQANGSLVRREAASVVGSELIGQPFDDPRLLLGTPVGDRARRRTTPAPRPAPTSARPTRRCATPWRRGSRRCARPIPAGDGARAGRPGHRLGERARSAHLAGGGATTRWGASRGRAGSPEARVRALVERHVEGRTPRAPGRAAGQRAAAQPGARRAATGRGTWRRSSAAAADPMSEHDRQTGSRTRCSARVQAEEARARRGQAQDLLRLRARASARPTACSRSRGTWSTTRTLDVVVGLVETHGRSETAALILGLELLPRRKVEYRGRVLEEFDLDAALARRPKLLLVDELAHTNAPGSRHAKRWQDVEELLEAGHRRPHDAQRPARREPQRRRRADHRRPGARDGARLGARRGRRDRAGRHRAGGAAAAARGGQGLPPRAGAARRRALLPAGQPARAARARAAPDGADASTRTSGSTARSTGSSSTWPAGERILVCVGPAPSSARLIRAARAHGGGAALHRGSRPTWSRPPWRRTGEADRERLEVHLRLAESLGATRRAARRPGASPTPSSTTRGGTTSRASSSASRPTPACATGCAARCSTRWCAAAARSTSTSSATPSGRRASRRSARLAAPPRHPAPYAFALSIVALTTALAAGVRALHPVPDLSVLYVVAVMVAAIRHGRGSSHRSRPPSSVACLRLLLRPALRTRSRWPMRATSSPSR